MRRIIRSAFGLVVAVTLTVSACSEQGSPIEPGLGVPGGVLLDVYGTSTDSTSTTSSTDTTAVSGTISTLDATVNVMPREVALASPIQVQKSIGVEGGKIEIPEAGLKIHIPNGALSQTTTITVTALAGSGVAYDFEPHGIVFNKPLIAVQSFKVVGTTVPEIQGGYFAANSDVDLVSLKGRIKELTPSETKLLEKKVKFNIHHFSGYLLSVP